MLRTPKQQHTPCPWEFTQPARILDRLVLAVLGDMGHQGFQQHPAHGVLVTAREESERAVFACCMRLQ